MRAMQPETAFRWLLHTPVEGPNWWRSATGDRAGNLWITGSPSLGRPAPIALSRDGGVSWEVEPFVSRKGHECMRCAPDGTPWIVGVAGTVLARVRGRWKRLRPGTKNHLFGVAFEGERTVCVVGAEGTILRSEDAGQRWIKLDAVTDRSLFDVACDPRGRWVAVGEDRVVLCSDDGERWTVTQPPCDPPERGPRRRLSAVEPFGEGRFVAAGDTLVLRSDDGGATWTDVSPEGLSHVMSLCVTPSKTWFVGALVTVHRSANEGASWHAEHTHEGEGHAWIYGLHVLDDGRGVGVGPHNTCWLRERVAVR